MSVKKSSRSAPKRAVSARKNARDLSRDKRRTLKARRRETQSRTLTFVLIGAVVVTGIFFYAMWRPEIRIESVRASGVMEPAVLESAAKKALTGTYAGVLPRDSFFLYPEQEVRDAVLATSPAIAAVSVVRSGFNALTVKATARDSAFLWCGAERASAGSCYDTDAEGLVFALVADDATTTPALRVYAPLSTEESGMYPLSARVEGSRSVPDILRFIKALGALGIRIVSIGIRGDEADVYLESGTKIMYVIGTEEETARIAGTALPGIDLTGGSIEYVDLRFGDKVYLKRKGE